MSVQYAIGSIVTILAAVGSASLAAILLIFLAIFSQPKMAEVAPVRATYSAPAMTADYGPLDLVARDEVKG